MITINLLPPELKKKETVFSPFKLDVSAIDIKKLPIRHIIMLILVFAFLIEALVFAGGIIVNASLARLSRRYDEMGPRIKEAKELKSQVDNINQISRAIDDLVSQRYIWALKLKALNDCMTPGIWLTEMDYNEKSSPKKTSFKKIIAGDTGKNRKAPLPGVLVFSGYAAGAGEQGTALIGKFIKSLQDNPEFAGDFSSIELVATKSDKVEKQDVMSFKINCYFE